MSNACPPSEPSPEPDPASIDPSTGRPPPPVDPPLSEPDARATVEDVSAAITAAITELTAAQALEPRGTTEAALHHVRNAELAIAALPLEIPDETMPVADGPTALTGDALLEAFEQLGIAQGQTTVAGTLAFEAQLSATIIGNLRQASRWIDLGVDRYRDALPAPT